MAYWGDEQLERLFDNPMPESVFMAIVFGLAVMTLIVVLLMVT